MAKVGFCIRLLPLYILMKIELYLSCDEINKKIMDLFLIVC